MGFYPSLPDPTNLSDVFKAFPKGVAHLLRYHDAILRSPSPLTIGERELIAAYVSGLNKCEFCFNAHSTYAETYGIDATIFEGLIEDVESADVPDNLKALLRYVGKLTTAPDSVDKADAKAVLDAGWPEEALADACYVTALYNFMNRIIHGSGIAPFDEDFEKRRASVRKRPLDKRLALNESHLGTENYVGYGRTLGLIED